MIPKIIHYCWLSNNPIPSKLQEYMESWKKQLPDYEFILWNFERFDINSSIWVKQAFEAKNMHLLLIILDYLLYTIMAVFIWIWMWRLLKVSILS